MRCGVVVFPGSTCDHDVYHVLKHVLGQEVQFLWHGDDTLKASDLVVLPGGFSYGDYLRAGAVAAHSPVMAAVARHAAADGLVLGIANGFQILLEAGLLPGAVRRNRELRFLCGDAYLKVERDDFAPTNRWRRGQVLRMPMAHAHGRYVDTDEALDRLEAAGQVVLRYCSPEGEVSREANPNGSRRAIAGICNEGGNVFGLMPHPERCAEEKLGNTDGRDLFAALVEAAGGTVEVHS
jgi:phosphoribosylformylglycinamidine synthase